jgi:hypothetical protein
VEIHKITNWIAGLFLAFLSWFGKITYDKLLSMDEKLEMVLIQNGIYKTKFENIENQIKQIAPCTPINNKPVSTSIKNLDAVIPEEVQNKRKYSLALK